MSGVTRRMHVERTEDPAVLRWVCHDDGLAAAAPGPREAPTDSPLGRLVAEGAIGDVTIRRGDVLIRADSWAALAPRVRVALGAELDAKDGSPDHWLLVAAGRQVLPSVSDVQHVVDRAAGGITAMHGGAMTVIAVEPGVVRLRATGACDGCSQSDETALATIAPAVRSEYPELTEIRVEPGTAARSSKSAAAIDRVRFGRS